MLILYFFFSVYYYTMSLSDFRPIFLYDFKLKQSAAETARKFNQAFGNDRISDVGLPNFVPKILASKKSPKVVDLQ